MHVQLNFMKMSSNLHEAFDPIKKHSIAYMNETVAARWQDTLHEYVCFILHSSHTQRLIIMRMIKSGRSIEQYFLIKFLRQAN